MDPGLRRALGAEIRVRRIGRGLSQAALGWPLTRAYVSSVEGGRTVPSLPALVHLAGRLGVPVSHLFDAVERRRLAEPWSRDDVTRAG
jgi:transcriptional regulator with XRE-family HTH domain